MGIPVCNCERYSFAHTAEAACGDQRLMARIAKLEAALRHIVGMAGNPSAAYGCRLIINRAKEALGEK